MWLTAIALPFDPPYNSVPGAAHSGLEGSARFKGLASRPQFVRGDQLREETLVHGCQYIGKGDFSVLVGSSMGKAIRGIQITYYSSGSWPLRPRNTC